MGNQNNRYSREYLEMKAREQQRQREEEEAARAEYARRQRLQRQRELERQREEEEARAEYARRQRLQRQRDWNDSSNASFANGNSENGKPPNSLVYDENRNAQQGRLQRDKGTPHGNKPMTTAMIATANRNTKSFAVEMVVCIT